MRLKFVVVDLELSRRTKRLAMSAGVLLLVLVGSALAYATLPHPKWITNDQLTADDLTNNFKNLDDRVTGLEAGTPSGAVMFFNLAACPSGWSVLVAAQGRYVVGLPPGGSLAATVGTALTDKENRAVGQHTHSISDPGHTHSAVAHSHTITISDPGHAHDTGVTNTTGSNPWWQANFGAGASATSQTGMSKTGISASASSVADMINTSTTGISVGNTGGVAGTNAPLIQLLVCQKN